MTHFDKDPVNTYRNLKTRIPFIRIKNKNFMNKLHNLDMSSDFWWSLSGEHAIIAEYLTILSIDNPRLLNDIKDVISIKATFSSEHIISSCIINSIGKDFILNKNFNLNKEFANKKDINNLLFDDEEKSIIINDNDSVCYNVRRSESEKEIVSIPMLRITNFLTRLRLKKFKFLYLKIKEKINFYINNPGNYDDKILFGNNSTKDFELFLNLLLPPDMKEYLPKWFVWISNYLVKSKHKWKTFFGAERDIYQQILNAVSYQKYGGKNFEVIYHGALQGINFWWLWRLSLFPDMKLKIHNILDIPKKSKSDLSEGILFCPFQLPWVGSFFYIEHFWDFMEVYKKAVKLLNIGLINNKKIKIRYKDFKFLSGFTGPFIREEFTIPVEKEVFENVYDKYKLIVCMPFGTISTKCKQNNISCISYNHPFYLSDRKSYLKINTYPGVYSDADKFLYDLEKRINNL